VFSNASGPKRSVWLRHLYDDGDDLVRNVHGGGDFVIGEIGIEQFAGSVVAHILIENGGQALQEASGDLASYQIGVEGFAGIDGQRGFEHFHLTSLFIDLEVQGRRSDGVMDVGMAALAGFGISVGGGKLGHIHAAGVDGAAFEGAVGGHDAIYHKVLQGQDKVWLGVAFHRFVLQIELILGIVIDAGDEVQNLLSGIQGGGLDAVAAAPGDMGGNRLPFIGVAVRVGSFHPDPVRRHAEDFRGDLGHDGLVALADIHAGNDQIDAGVFVELEEG